METDRNQPKSLNTKQKDLVNKLVVKFGKNLTNIKRADLKKAIQGITGLKYEPTWIVRNPDVQSKDNRGQYRLDVLAKLPVVAFSEHEVKKVLKKKQTKKIVEKKKLAKKMEKEPETVVLDGVPLFPPSTKKPQKTKKVKEVVESPKPETESPKPETEEILQEPFVED